MEQLTPPIPTIFSAEEYLNLERASEVRHELRRGVIVSMAGGTLDHGTIALNFGAELRNKLKGKPCRVSSSDTRVRVGKSVNYYYPDITVICGDPVFDPIDSKSTVKNPTLVIEVTSPTSEIFDRTEKFRNYMRIDSLQEYVVVDQMKPMVEHFYRQSNGVWAIGGDVEDIHASITLRSLENIEVALAEIYSGLTFSPLKPDADGAASMANV